MHSLLSRGNSMLAYTLIVLVTLVFACFLSTISVDYRTGTEIQALKIEVKNLPTYGVSKKINDLGHIKFNLNTDLTSLFNWNVKQLFVYMTAEYETPTNALNQVVLWDKIILRGEKSYLRLKNMRTKYYFWDDGNGLRQLIHLTCQACRLSANEKHDVDDDEELVPWSKTCPTVYAIFI
ncbi:unnamed protein product [Macrosiphum euphorbiae]|uniref:Signal peptidase complex subunit 3 n=1 Tax=Macrosiphum euphorbiae TaxID=13131 RepID=A0AAV0Y142_9HEMI|nr:unnamed protein product [Macrosiphum euphorbiae]